MTANTEITELIRSELCRFLQDACAGKTGVKLDMDNPAAEVSAPLGFVTGYTAQFWAERLTDQLVCIQGLCSAADAEASGGSQKESGPHGKDPDPCGDQRRYRQGSSGRLP